MIIRLFCLGVLLSFMQLLSAQGPTRMLSQPALSEDHVVFTYANDLWIADRDGQNPRRLTIDEGTEAMPVFSNDGKLIAFSGEYDGNVDVFTVPASGGIPKRLTWHPGNDNVADFTPDGKGILYATRRASFSRTHAKPYTVGLDGGYPEPLGVPTAYNGTYSPDGKYLAYNPLPEAFRQWKNYRGGRFSRIWIQDLADNSVEEIPIPESGANDVQPQWIDGKVYFRSDRNGEFNLYVYDPATKAVEQLTDYEDFPILDLGSGAGDLVYAQEGWLHIFDPATKQFNRIDININTDLLERRPRIVSGRRHIRSGGVSPSAARVVMDYRGDILTAPVEDGDVVNLTNTPDVHESYPAWSPNGKTIAYFSDASGEHQLHLYDVKSKKAREVKLGGTGFYAYPHWAPNSERLCLVDNGRNLYVVEAASGKVSKVDADDHYFPGAYRDLFGSWSHDSRWLAYTKMTETNFEQALVYDTETGTVKPVSDGLSNVTEPTFSPDGQYLYLAASTDAGPVVNWFQQSSADMQSSNAIYLVTLRKDIVSPLKRNNDEEVIEDEEETDDAGEESGEEEDDSMKIDFDGIENRIIDLPVPSGNYYNLAATKSGLLFISQGENGGQMMSFSLDSREAKPVMATNGFEIAGKGDKMLFVRNGRWGVAPVGKKSDEFIDLSGLRVKVDPMAEWKNIFYEAWRVNRDYFYDPGMHGVDWEAMKKKYEVFLPHVTSQDDLYAVMRWMMSELGVGHHRFSGPAPLTDSPDRVSGGMLGADYEVVNDRYRIKKIYGGLNWNPDMRSPLTEPGVNVSEGEYILAVDGENLAGSDNIFRLFEDKANRNVTLTVGPNPDGSGARDVVVTTIRSEYSLRNRDWVEGNLRRVHEATDGRVAYVYVPNTAGAGHAYFKRYFFPQVDKEAIIVDERFNGGGQIADYYVELLSRPYQNSWTYRYGKDQHAPLAAIHGPKVLLVNEAAGSGGDLFPYLWRQYDLGPIIGKRTWGGLVGVLGYPEFIDGGSVTAPNVAFWDKDGYRVENEGVTPDIDVDQLPAEVMEGRDPQLERAIEEILKMLDSNPAPTYQRPPFEKRGAGLRNN
jgi:tricorn protease